MKSMRSALLTLLATTALVAGACGKKDDGGASHLADSPTSPPTYEVRAQPGLTGTAQRLAAAGTVKVGVKSDQPNLGYKNPTTNEFSGFDIEIAKMVAADLGIPADKITFVQIPSKNREIALANGEVDLYVGTYTINDKRKKQVDFAGPYFVAGQDLLVRADDTAIKGPDSLAGKTVCSATGSTPIERIKSAYKRAKTTEFDVYSKCVDALLDGTVDAVTTDDAILAGYAAEEPGKLRVVGRPFSKEAYGVGLKKGDRALQDAIARALKRHEDNGDYARAYAATLGRSGVPLPPVPAIVEGRAT
jgi:glutamate transport system substrate-binding protein